MKIKMQRSRHEQDCLMFVAADRVSPKPIKIAEGLKCSKCWIISKNAPAFSRHKKTCGVCCEACHQTFTNTSKLIQHMETHDASLMLGFRDLRGTKTLHKRGGWSLFVICSDWFSGPPVQKCRRTVVIQMCMYQTFICHFVCSHSQVNSNFNPVI